MSNSRVDPTGDWSWWYRFVAVWAGVAYLLIAAALVFGPPKWTTGNSLQTLHDHAHIPWSVWALAFVAVPFGLAIARVRLWAYLWGAVLAIFFSGLAIIFSVLLGRLTNPVNIALSTLAIPMMFAGVRYSVLNGDHVPDWLRRMANR